MPNTRPNSIYKSLYIQLILRIRVPYHRTTYHYQTSLFSMAQGRRRFSNMRRGAIYSLSIITAVSLRSVPCPLCPLLTRSDSLCQFLPVRDCPKKSLPTTALNSVPESLQSLLQDIELDTTQTAPKFQQAFIITERVVKTIKSLLSSLPDADTALLFYRSTPMEHGYSLAQLLFEQRIRSTLPMTTEQRRPTL